MRHPRNYRILIAIAFLQGMVFYAPVATRYRLDNGLSLSGLFAIESISWILTILLEAPFGLLADRLGHRRIIVAGNACFALSKLVFATATGFGPFLAERALLALSLAALSGASEAFLSDCVGLDGREGRFGLWNAAGTAGLLAASLASPFIYGPSLRGAAIATIFPYAAAAGLSFCLAEVGGPRSAGVADGTRAALRSSLRGLLKDPGLLRFLLAGAIITEYGQALVFLGQLQYERAGIDRAWFGIIFATLQGAALLAAASGRLARAFGRKPVLAAIVAISGLCAAVLALSANPVASLVALAVSASATAVFRPISTVIQLERIGGSDRATALSLNAMVSEASAALVNLAAGPAAQASLSLGFGCFAMALFLLLLFWPFFFRLPSPEGGEVPESLTKPEGQAT
jgi:MFS family permease